MPGEGEIFREKGGLKRVVDCNFAALEDTMIGCAADDCGSC